MIRVRAATVVAAPKEVVSGLYRDYARWPAIFPAIAAVRLLREEPGRLVLEVDHRTDGKVLNTLAGDTPDEVVLEEWKPAYDARFLNRFETVPGGTRYTVVGDIRLKGLRRLLAPFVRGRARRLVERFQLRPVKAAAEATRD